MVCINVCDMRPGVSVRKQNRIEPREKEIISFSNKKRRKPGCSILSNNFAFCFIVPSQQTWCQVEREEGTGESSTSLRWLLKGSHVHVFADM